jgi:hypothetical protein
LPAKGVCPSGILCRRSWLSAGCRLALECASITLGLFPAIFSLARKG